MKKVFLFMFLIALATPSLAQSAGRKLSSEEAAQKTPDQRYVYETERKAKKKKKKNVSTKKKVRIQEKQDRQMRKKKKGQRRS
jgi:hypothetical protein